MGKSRTDVFSCTVVSWQFGECMTSDLVLDVLSMAAGQRKPAHVIHHSDPGSPYTSIAFGNCCKEMGVRPSMGTVGDAYDNAMAESFCDAGLRVDCAAFVEDQNRGTSD